MSIPASGGPENLEALAPLVVTLQETGSEQAYLRSLDRFVEEKEKQIEDICDENYEVRIFPYCKTERALICSTIRILSHPSVPCFLFVKGQHICAGE